MKAFDQLYNLTSRKLVGRNYHRSCNQHRLPHVLTCLDAEGSKFWRFAGQFENLHFHSIWLIDKSDASQFENVMSMSGSMGDVWRSLSFDEIEASAVNTSEDGQIERAVSYASKLVGFNNLHLTVGQDFEIYPRGQNDRSRTC